MYYVQKNLTRLNNLGYTYFLDPKEMFDVTSKLKKNDYSIYYPYKDSEKVIVYKKDIPEVLLYEVHSKIGLRHQDILGTLYSLNISSDLFGDVLIINGHYYIYILPILRNYFETNFLNVRNSYIELECIDIKILENYERDYEKLEFIVSSNRVDTVISSILHTSRGNIDDYIKKKEIILNYDYLKNESYKLKDGDTFSIKRVGKFKYNGIIKNTKSNHLIVEILKYK